MNEPQNLTIKEIIKSGLCGVLRVSQIIKDNLQETHGSEREGEHGLWQRHIEAAMGECAVAKFLGLYWPGTGRLFGVDIPPDIQVRHTEDHDYRLILHKPGGKHGDDPDHFYWLVTGLLGKYMIRGWIQGRDGQRAEWWQDPQGTNRHAYFVPRDQLLGLDEWNAR